jgi:hypothetical protein
MELARIRTRFLKGRRRGTWWTAALAAVLLLLIGGMRVAWAESEGVKAERANPSPPEIIVLNKHEVQGVLGREVRSATDENMGRIVDVLVDRTGQVRAAIIDFGGFLGVGSRKIAVDWNALHFPPPGQADGHIVLDLTRDQVKAAPAYEEGKPVVILSALGKLEPLPQ